MAAFVVAAIHNDETIPTSSSRENKTYTRGIYRAKHYATRQRETGYL